MLEGSKLTELDAGRLEEADILRSENKSLKPDDTLPDAELETGAGGANALWEVAGGAWNRSLNGLVLAGNRKGPVTG